MRSRFLNKITFIIIAAAVLAIVMVILLLSRKADKTMLMVEQCTVEDLDDILPIKDSLVIPILYDNVQLLTKLDTEIRKKRFIDVILPGVLVYRYHLRQNLERVQILKKKSIQTRGLSPEDSLFISQIFKNYKTQSFSELLKRMQPPPVSLVLAQAALESGWGSSRFFKEANNVFGIWSFSDTDERIPAHESREGKTVYLKKYENLLGSIEDYHLLCASSDYYQEFRDCINRSNNVFELIWYLRMYSERRDQYVIMLRNVIVANDLLQYDAYQLHPEYFDFPSDIK